MAKTFLRRSKASGTDRAKVERLLKRGWHPGKRIGNYLSNRQKGVGRDE